MSFSETSLIDRIVCSWLNELIYAIWLNCATLARPKKKITAFDACFLEYCEKVEQSGRPEGGDACHSNNNNKKLHVPVRASVLRYVCFMRWLVMSNSCRALQHTLLRINGYFCIFFHVPFYFRVNFSWQRYLHIIKRAISAHHHPSTAILGDPQSRLDIFIFCLISRKNRG